MESFCVLSVKILIRSWRGGKTRMAIVMRRLPQCDVCGGVWLPGRQLPGGKLNEAFDNPQLCKRCGKCKTPRWNEVARMKESAATASVRRQQKFNELELISLREPIALVRRQVLTTSLKHPDEMGEITSTGTSPGAFRYFRVKFSNGDTEWFNEDEVFNEDKY
jgi:hypothetical protein